MDILKCTAFLKSVELGSILAAANELDYSPSGINRMISSLEDELGIILLKRGRNGVTLTEDGQTVLPVIGQIVHYNTILLETCTEINQQSKKKINIGSFSSIAANRLPQIVRDFSNLYPGVFLNISERKPQELTKCVKAGSLDCCFRHPSSDEDLDFIPLEEDPIVVWLPENHPLTAYQAVPLHELENYPYISWNNQKDSFSHQMCVKYHLNLNIQYNAEDAATIYHMVEQNLGISLNNALTSSKWNGSVVVLPLDPPQYIHLGLITSKSRRNSILLEHFISFIRENWDFYIDS